MKQQAKVSISIVSLLAIAVVAAASARSTAYSIPPLSEQDRQALSWAPDRSSGMGETAATPAGRLKDDDVLALARAAASESSLALERAINQGSKAEAEIFSTLYFPANPLTSPRTFTTFYDDYADAAIRPIEDRVLEANTGLVYAVLVDRNGYVPSHNTRFSEPRTGKMELDLKSNRTKRIFNDITGFHAAKNRQDFLFQTYRRDTGETMKDLSVPVYVKGKHWGAFRIGYGDE